MKKFLSLVLALVMTMSLVTVSAGAKDFTDDDSITYKEAVDVMSAVKVVDGYADGSFNPNATLTRGAAAKIICNMILGPTTASALSADTAPFSDVPVDHTFAGYIAYCSQQGIISGYADGTFRPAATLTSYAFMKMLLGALGYDADIEGYVGANWSIQVAKRALNIGLDDGLVDTFVGTKAVTREEACLYAYNTLTADMVEYDTKTNISVGGAEVIIAGSAAKKVEQAPYKSYDGKADDVLQFCEKYFSDLKLTSDTNALKKPVDKWKLKSDSIGKYAVYADKVAVVADKDKTINDILTSSSYMDYSASDIKLTTALDGNGIYAYINAAEQSSLTASTLTKGDVVYAYENDDGEVVKVVVARYTYAKIDSTTTKVSTAEEDAGASVRLKLVDIDDNNIGTYYDDNDTASKKLNGYDAETYEEDVVLAIAKNGSTIVDSYVAEIVTGKPSSVKNTVNGNITVDGTKYNFAGDPAGRPTNFDFDKEYDVVVTKEGYAIAIDGVNAADLSDIYYVAGFYREVTGGGEYYYAQRVSMDGKIDNVKLEVGSLSSTIKNAVDAAADSSTVIVPTGAGLYTFNDKKDATLNPEAKAGNGKYTLVPFASDADVAKNFGATNDGVYDAEKELPEGGIKSDASKVSVTGEGSYYVNEETKFLAVEKMGSAIDVTTAVGGMKSAQAPAIVIYDIDDGKTAVAVIIADPSNALTVSDATKDVVYLDSASSTKVSNDDYSATLYFMNDNTSKDVIIDGDGCNAQGFYTYSETDGVYKLVDDADALTITGAEYDDESGYVLDAVITDVYKTLRLSTTTSKVEDINFNDVVIIDNRDDAVIDADIYGTEITTIADLKDAVETAGYVVADMYFDEGVTFIAVDSVGAGLVNTDEVVTTYDDDTDTWTLTFDGEVAVKDLLDLVDDGTDVYYGENEESVAKVTSSTEGNLEDGHVVVLETADRTIVLDVAAAE